MFHEDGVSFEKEKDKKEKRGRRRGWIEKREKRKEEREMARDQDGRKI